MSPDDENAGVVDDDAPVAATGTPGDGELAGIRAALDELEYQRNGPDLAERLITATSLARRAQACSAVTEQMRAVLVMADLNHFLGQVEVGARLARQVQRWAGEHGPQSLLARSHLVLSMISDHAGDAAGALEHALRAVEFVDQADTRTRAHFVLNLADSLVAAGRFESAWGSYAEAERLSIELDDRPLLANTLNNRADTELGLGQFERAWQTATRMLELVEGPEPLLLPAYYDTLANAMIGVGRIAQGRLLAEQGMRRLDAGAELNADTLAQLTMTLAKAHRLRGDLGAAQEYLDRSIRLCDERGLAVLRARAYGEQSELHAAAGAYREALHAHREYFERTVRLIDRERESTIDLRQARYATNRAERDAARFWDQARSDPLTGLRNRRYVDEELPGLLDRSRVEGIPMVAAIVDADHFKTINDRFHHQVGDQVLCALADLLGTMVQTWQSDHRPEASRTGLAARLGGEEFVLVLTGHPITGARQVLLELPAAVREYPWSTIAEDLRVTVSVGVALAGSDDSQHSLLARADRRLYEAKEGGRDRGQADPPRAHHRLADRDGAGGATVVELHRHRR